MARCCGVVGCLLFGWFLLILLCLFGCLFKVVIVPLGFVVALHVFVLMICLLAGY